MKTLVATIVILISISGIINAQDIERIKQAEAKVEEIIFDSEELGQKRQVIIQTPQRYNVDEMSYYNVIYVFDAQDRPLFDYTTGLANLINPSSRNFIVVGIKATFIEEDMYGRNHDLLPAGTNVNLGPKSGGNAERFLAFVKNEVVPYVESNYKTLPHNIAVGHSLSASFLIYSMLHETELFDNYIAISPNLAYDEQYLVNELRHFNSEQFTKPTYVYMSHADEERGWPNWGDANEAAYPLLRDTLANENFIVEIEEYPEETHRTTIVPSLNSAMETVLGSVLPKQNTLLSDETYQITIRLEVQNEDDNIFIAGNQESLANWETGQVKMNHASANEREITLEVQDPVEMKFFHGDGDTQAWVAFGGGGRSNFPIILRPEDNATYTYQLAGDSQFTSSNNSKTSDK
jgi:hypothetical protein